LTGRERVEDSGGARGTAPDDVRYAGPGIPPVLDEPGRGSMEEGHGFVRLQHEIVDAVGVDVARGVRGIGSTGAQRGTVEYAVAPAVEHGHVAAQRSESEVGMMVGVEVARSDIADLGLRHQRERCLERTVSASAEPKNVSVIERHETVAADGAERPVPAAAD